MQQHVLARLLHAPPDLDYVDRFQALQTLNLSIRRSGPNATRLLQKSILEMEVGNYPAALDAARDAVVLDATLAEAHFQVGRACVFLALARAEAMPLGPKVDWGHRESVTDLCLKAADAFRRVLDHNGADDEAARDLEALQEIMAPCETEAELLAALREAWA